MLGQTNSKNIVGQQNLTLDSTSQTFAGDTSHCQGFGPRLFQTTNQSNCEWGSEEDKSPGGTPFFSPLTESKKHVVSKKIGVPLNHPFLVGFSMKQPIQLLGKSSISGNPPTCFFVLFSWLHHF